VENLTSTLEHTSYVTSPVFFGGTKLTEDNIVISVPAIQLVYFVTADTKRQDAK